MRWRGHPATVLRPPLCSLLEEHTSTDCSHCNTLQHTATYCSTLQHTAAHYCVGYYALRLIVQHTATHYVCNTLQHTATHCSTLQHTATSLCNTLQRTTCALKWKQENSCSARKQYIISRGVTIKSNRNHNVLQDDDDTIFITSATYHNSDGS